MNCSLCSRDPCTCGLVSVKTEDEAIELLRTWLPRGASFGDDPPLPELLFRILTHPRSPLKISDDVLVGFTRRLYELAQDAPSSPPSLEQVWNALGMDLSVAAQRVGEALAFLVEETMDLVESHPMIKDHRAYVIDQTMRILAGDRYPALRAAAFGADYNQGVEPPRAEDDTEPS